MSDDYSWWDELSPYEQESLMSVLDPTLGMEAANTAVPGYNFADIVGGGGYAPQMSPEDFALSQFGGALPPELNKYGELMPWGMDQEAQATTLQKNRNSLLVDRAMSMLSGPGSYSATAFDPITITPAQAGEAALDMPGRRRAGAYLGGTGYETFIADAIVNRGLTPSEATTEMWKLVSRPDSEELDPETRQMRKDLIATLPAAQVDALTAGAPSFRGQRAEADLTTPEGLAQVYDVKGINSFAQDLFGDISGDPEGVWQDPETQQWYSSGPKQVDSEMTQWYKSYGLPTPVETYLDEAGLNLLGAPPEAPEERQQRFDILDAADLAYQDAIAAERQAEDVLGTITQGRKRGQQAYQETMRQPTAGFGGQASRRLRAEGARSRETPRVKGEQQRIAEPSYTFAGEILEKLAPGFMSENVGPAWRRGGRMVDAREQRRARGNERTAASIRRHMAQEQIRAQDRASTGNSRARAAAIGSGLAAQMQGRTPLRDALTQRLLGQRAVGLYGG